MKVLVTGANGFIGKHVCEALQKAGHVVFGLDLSLHDVACDVPVIADIRHPQEPVPGIDAVIHLAAVANPRECDTNPTNAFDVNVNGTLQVLKMALASGAKKMVFSSSAHVYGVGPKYWPTDETHPLSLGNTYTTTKILGEALCELYWENHGLPYTTLRLFNAYGPGQGAGYFVPDMVNKLRTGRVDIKGGDTTKDFVYIDDVARAFVLALGSPFVGPINIGTGRETQLAEIVELLANGPNPHIPWSASSGQGDATRMKADITRARRVLGWQPTKDILQGLGAVITDAIISDQAKSKPVPA